MFCFLGSSNLLWTQKLLFLHAILPVSAVLSHAPVIMRSPPPSPHRPSRCLSVVPYSTLAKSLFDWLSSRPGSYDNDDGEK